MNLLSKVPWLEIGKLALAVGVGALGTNAVNNSTKNSPTLNPVINIQVPPQKPCPVDITVNGVPLK